MLPVEGHLQEEELPLEAEPADVQSVSQELTLAGGPFGVPKKCDPPKNFVCLGSFGRICRFQGATWCEWWVCGIDGCRWEWPSR
jgi:hypothetical protein